MRKNGVLNTMAMVALWGALMVSMCLLAACSSKSDQNQPDLNIDKIIFTRTGLFVKAGDQTTIDEVTVFKEDRKLGATRPDASGETLVDFRWQPGEKYVLNVATGKGTLTTPVYAPFKPSPVKLAEIPLEALEKGEMEYLYYAWRGAQVRFSPDGAYIGVGSKGGYVHLIDMATRQTAWTHKIPEGRVAKVAFTRDGRLIAGEESLDGNIYCFDAVSGKVLWQYRSAENFDLTHARITARGMFKGYPLMCWGLCVDGQNNAYVMVRHDGEEERQGRTQTVSNAIVIKLDTATGKPIWKFPIQTSAWGLVLSGDGRYLFPCIGFADEAVLSVLDTQSGSSLWQYSFKRDDPARSRFGTGFEGDISPDGRFLVVNQISPNGTFVFDLRESVRTGQASLLWQRQFVKPLDVGGIPINLGCINLKLTDSDLIFSTYSARVAVGSTNQAAMPARHPDADTLFVYDFDGNLKWKWKIGEGTWNSDGIFSADARFLVLPLGIVPANSLADPDGMGVYVFSPAAPGGASNKLDWFYHTEGFAYKADISADGKHIVVLEGPFDIDPDQRRERIVGKHRLLILS